ncbi:amidase signature enzyme [Lophiostoma macrostomum CBS 122681]|uniref:Amidase signature enzyme n=1 Tax=Lophiostoma macrostomum CBS 122681 TaxID=1314788 RepID=A0A6A6TFN1_9PLEO|nr:amidase signature enzyme [Lophiostoma macrostomum CBS 122681]
MSSLHQPSAQRTVIQLGESSYYVRSRVEYELPLTALSPATSPAPAVVISVSNASISLQTICEKLSRFAAEDDVFQQQFTVGGYLIVQELENKTNETLPRDLLDFLHTNSLNLLTLKTSLPEGPYIALGQCLHQAWRLYPDTLSAFATVVIPDDAETAESDEDVLQSYEEFSAASIGDSTSSIPVPSRLYYQKTTEKPLAGLRITIKDNMHLNGITTGLGNRAFAELYGKQTTTAEYVRMLQQKGAIILGKTKMSAFAGSEVPPNQCIDYFPPWNARGDGYQGPSGSSSGAAATIAGYPWLDISLCTDTSGSMRFPASSHGAWGHRATWGSLPMEGIVPAVPAYDSIGLLSRTPDTLRDLLTITHTRESYKKPTRLIYPSDWYPLPNRAQQVMTGAFMKVVEDYLGIEHVEISLLDEWTKTGPEDLRDLTLIAFLAMSAYTVNGWYGYHTFDDFRRDYPLKFGKKPYVSPSHSARCLDKIKTFKDWFDQVIWQKDDPDALTIMLVPQGRPGANYRDTVPESSDSGGPDPMSYDEVFVTSMLGCPQLVIPIGQNPYESKVSGLIEYAPIVTTLIGPARSDQTLVDVASNALIQAGWPTTVLAGRLMFDLGDNDRNSDVIPKGKL